MWTPLGKPVRLLGDVYMVWNSDTLTLLGSQTNLQGQIYTLSSAN